MVAKYLLLKHYRGAPASVNDVPMDQWTPEEISAHVQYMHDFAARLEGTGEFVDSQALAREGTFVRYDGQGRPPVTDGPFAETKDVIAGWMVIDVDSYERAIELAGPCRPPLGRAGSRSTSGSRCARFWPRRHHHAVTSGDERGPAPQPHARRAGRAGRGGRRLAGRPAAGPEGLAGHRGLAPVPRRDPGR
jgi:hypothetical protein